MAAIDVQITAIPTVEITHQNVFVGGVVTEQINGVTIGTSVSGSTNNQVIENTLGTPVGTSANPSVVPDATVQLNGVDMVDVPSGETDNIEIRQSTGATQVGSKQGVHWRIDDSEISINGSPVADVKSEDSLDIDVTQDGSPVGSWNGSAWIVPSCVSPSLSIEVYSDAGYSIPVTSLDYGATAYIKLVSSYITPTSYSFFFGNGTNNAPQVTQAGNTLAWVVSLTGTITISATATEGTTATADATPFALTSTLVITKSLKFDGVNDFSEVISPVEYTQDFSITLWFKLNVIIGNQKFLFEFLEQKNAQPWAFQSYYEPADGKIHFMGWGGSFNPRGLGINFTADTSWHHLTFTYQISTNTWTGYIDGVNGGSISIYTLTRNFDTFNLGTGYFGSTIYSPVNLADVSIHNTVLTQPEITAMQILGVANGSEVMRFPITEPVGTTTGFINDIVGGQKMKLKNMTTGFGIVAVAP